MWLLKHTDLQTRHCRTQIFKAATELHNYPASLYFCVLNLSASQNKSSYYGYHNFIPGRNPSLLIPEKGKSLARKSGRRKDDRYIHPTCLIRPWTKLLSSPVADRSHQGAVCGQSIFSICSKFCWAVLRHSNISHHTIRPAATLWTYSSAYSSCRPRSTLQPSVRAIPVELRNAPVHTQHCSPSLAPLQGTNHWHHRDSHSTGGLNLKLQTTSDVRGKV